MTMMINDYDDDTTTTTTTTNNNIIIIIELMFINLLNHESDGQ
jgi:hypothetical protein